jgi:proteasome lid subunit RPN8/RPN11
MPQRIKKTLTLRSAHYAQIIDHARSGWPFEVCGIVGGWDAVAQIVLPLPNIASAPINRYQVDPTAFIIAYHQIEQTGGELIGLYHSHPHGAPIPSAVDVAEATWPEAAYLIVGFTNDVTLPDPIPTLTAWSIRREIVTAIALIVD